MTVRWRHRHRKIPHVPFSCCLFNRLPVRIATFDLHHGICLKNLSDQSYDLEHTFPLNTSTPCLDCCRSFFTSLSTVRKEKCACGKAYKHHQHLVAHRRKSPNPVCRRAVGDFAHQAPLKNKGKTFLSTSRVHPGILIDLTLCGCCAVTYAPVVVKWVLEVFFWLSLDGKIFT